MRSLPGVLLTLGVLVAACGGDGGSLEVTDVRMAEPTGPNTAVYLTVSNDGDADRLVAVSTAVADSVQIHETKMDDDGTTHMQKVESLELPSGGTLVLEPGGYHVMLVDVERLAVGETVEVHLDWERGGDMTVFAEVIDPAETPGDG